MKCEDCENFKAKQPEAPAWFKVGWWASLVHQGKDRIGCIPPDVSDWNWAGQFYKVATLDDLAVDMGGVKCWFVENKNVVHLLVSPQCAWAYGWSGNYCVLARAIAAKFDAPIIPAAQWDYLRRDK